MSSHEMYMAEAIEMATRQPKYPFGCVLVDRENGEIVARGYNRGCQNPTWHGEIDAINNLVANSAPRDWSELDLYTTAEPCPMCQGAILWAAIGRVIYGTSIPRLMELGWKQIDIRAEEVVTRSTFGRCELIGGVLASECDQLFRAAMRRQTSGP
jgi:tRNA(Arg) A34 adenosine deaminase TadA